MISRIEVLHTYLILIYQIVINKTVTSVQQLFKTVTLALSLEKVYACFARQLFKLLLSRFLQQDWGGCFFLRFFSFCLTLMSLQFLWAKKLCKNYV